MPRFGPFAFDLVEWDAWTPELAARVLEGVEAPWCVAAGWALDLFLGGGLREHEDLELAVPEPRFAEVAAALAPLEPYVPSCGIATPLAEANPSATQQTWFLDRRTERWRLDVFREPSADGLWLCRRDQAIRLPYSELIEISAAGVPYLRPEVVLLFKAKHSRPKDESDFAAVLPYLDGKHRRWLRDALERVHPGHRWLAALAG